MSMNNNEVVNSKAGRTTEAETGARKMTSVLEAIKAKYNLPVTAYDWLNPKVQVLNYRLSEVNEGQSEDVAILSMHGVPIVFNADSKKFFPAWNPEYSVDLEESVFNDDFDENKRIDLSYLVARLEEIAKEASEAKLTLSDVEPMQWRYIDYDQDLFYVDDADSPYTITPKKGEWDGRLVRDAINSLLPEGMSFIFDNGDGLDECLVLPDDERGVVPVLSVYPVDRSGCDDYDPIAYLSLGLIEMLRNEMKKDS